MDEIKIDNEGALFAFGDIFSFRGVEKSESCFICKDSMSRKYNYILKKLKEANLLEESVKPLCCFCYAVIYDKESVESIMRTMYSCDVTMYRITIKSGVYNSCRGDVVLGNNRIRTDTDPTFQKFLKNANELSKCENKNT